MPSQYVLKPKFKIVQCISCPTTTTVGIKRRKPFRCLQCSIKVMIEANRQMHEHSGPAYDKWRERMIEWARAQGMATPPPSSENSPSHDGG